MNRLAQWWPLALILAAAGLFYLLGARHVLSVDMLRAWQADLERLATLHPVLAGLAFVAATAAYLMLSLPAEGLLTAAGGMLFGTVLGSALSVVGTVLAALLLFVVLRRVLRRQLAAPQGPKVERALQRLERDGFNYLLMLRLLPVLPFALISLTAVMARMRTRPYTLATAIGVVPPTVVFASLGHELGALLARPGPVDLGSLLSWQLVLSLAGVAALALLPVARHYWREHAAWSLEQESLGR